MTPTPRRVTLVRRAMAGNRPAANRLVRRHTRITPLLRPIEPAYGPSRAAVVQHWEELDWWSCVYCDGSFSEMVVPEMDHITPLAKGGVHAMWNIAPACAECNRAKADRDVAEWLSVFAGQAP
ncbi:HNH endonuclease signature motif containing protein [Streptomyces sp. NRRL S-378]|uniref:HNH endonuclease n=1 Tax=Streptomyces sp. NRRL S-378 TaxID=1463904 RepID=UPI00099D5E09